MIYELRVYRCVPGRLPALLSRFQNHTLRIWERHGIRQAGFWTPLVGENSQDLTYLLAWESLAERERRTDRTDHQQPVADAHRVLVGQVTRGHARVGRPTGLEPVTSKTTTWRSTS